jgi:hypothetical protein
MLQCYVDESGNNHGSKMIMVGVLAHSEEWTKFVIDWQECLDMRPTMNALHMSEIMMRDSDEATERVARFYKICCQHIKGAIILSLNLERYKELFRDLRVWKNPYCFMFFMSIYVYRLEFEKLNLPREAEFIFDRQIGAERLLKEGWNYFEEHNPEVAKLLGDFPKFRDDQQALPLQAADFFAWWCRAVLSGDLSEEEAKSKARWKFTDSVPYIRYDFNDESLRNVFRIMTS